MTERTVPILRVQNVRETARRHGCAGFRLEGIRQGDPNMPKRALLKCGGIRLHFSERQGDAAPNSLGYFNVDEVEAAALVFGERVKDPPRRRKVSRTNPCGHRLRVATRNETDQSAYVTH